MVVAGFLMQFTLLSVATALYIYTPELFPTRIRATGVGTATTAGRIASIVGPLLVPPLVLAWAVRTLSPDLQQITRLPIGGLIITTKRRTSGVASRYFTPAYRIPKDPKTDSAHSTIAPYRRNELRTTLPAEQTPPTPGDNSPSSPPTPNRSF